MVFVRPSHRVIPELADLLRDKHEEVDWVVWLCDPDTQVRPAKLGCAATTRTFLLLLLAGLLSCNTA